MTQHIYMQNSQLGKMHFKKYKIKQKPNLFVVSMIMESQSSHKDKFDRNFEFSHLYAKKKL